MSRGLLLASSGIADPPRRGSFELKDDSVVRGQLYDVDRNLNCNLTEVSLTRHDGSKRSLEATYVNGTMIRYVRFPDDVRPHHPAFRL